MSSGDASAAAENLKDNVQLSEQSNEADGGEEATVEEIADASTPSASQLTAQMMQNPQVLAALQHHIQDMVGQSSGYIESLPKAVKKRVNALKNLLVKSLNIESKFYAEVHELERKYMGLYTSLYDRRRDIIAGAVQPTESECEWESEDDEDECKDSAKNKDELNALTKEIEDKANVEDDAEEVLIGIPEFWLAIFKSTDILQDMIQDHDEQILKSLKDIRVVFSEPSSQMAFTLEFVFGPNEYFTNNILRKHYKLCSCPDEKDPFSFDGLDIIGCTGCQIDWKKGKNVTVKTIKKKQKHKGRGTVRTVQKQVANDSFFNFFSPPEVPDDADLDSDTENLLSTDYEIGHMIKERIVPRAVLYFTGEAQMDYDYDEEEEEDEDGHIHSLDDSGDSENDSDNDPNVRPGSKLLNIGLAATTAT